MKEWNIKITDDGKVYINGKECYCSVPMDKSDKEVDADKRALLSLADEMGYEATYLFEEMAYRLEEMLHEIDEEYIPSSTRGDYSPSNPWDAPGMSVRDFI